MQRMCIFVSLRFSMTRLRFICIILLFISLLGPDALCGETRLARARNGYASALKQRPMHQIILALVELANAVKKDKPDSAYYKYTLALKLADRFAIKSLRPQIYFELAEFHGESSDLKTAVAYFDSARNAALRNGDYTTVSNVLNMLGTLHLDVWNPKDAKALFEESYAIALKNGLNRQAGVALGNLARFSSDADSSVHQMKNAVELVIKGTYAGSELAEIYINMANRQENPDSAIHWYQTALRSAKEETYPLIAMQACNNMAYSLLEKGQAGLATDLLKHTAIPLAKADSNFDWLATLYDTWADMEGSRNRFKEAWQLEKESVKARTEAELRKSSRQVQLLIMLLDVKNKDLKISLTVQQVKDQEQNIRRLEILVVLIFVVALLIIVAGIVVQQKAKIRRQRTELDVIRRQAETEDLERTRISMQLHDLTGSMEIKMARRLEEISMDNQESKSVLMAEFKNQAAIIHSLSYRLNKAFVEDLPFPRLIGNILDDYRKISNLKIGLVIEKGTLFPSKHKFQYIYIIQELLNNALKHVVRGKVTFEMTLDSGNHYLFYEDNGPGFDANATRNHSMGLRNIVDRTRLMEGKATLTASPGKGTRWIIAVPWHENEQHEPIG